MTTLNSTRAWALLAAVNLSGCAALPEDGGRQAVEREVAARGIELAPPGAPALAPTAGKPLDRGAALGLALANNPDLRAQFARLGFAAADVFEAGRLANPVLSASLLEPDEGDASSQVGFGITQRFTELLLLPASKRFAEGEFQRVQLLVASAVLDLAAEVDAAVVRLAAAGRTAELHQAIAETAQTSALLAERFFTAGNISRLELVRERAAASEAEIERIGAAAARDSAHAELQRLMGLGEDAAGWSLDWELAKPQATTEPLDALLTQAAGARLDLAAAQRAVELQADATQLTHRTRWLGHLEAGVETERETDRSRLTGPTLALELPLFNQGQGRIAHSEAALALAQAELQALQLDVARELRIARTAVEAARQRALQYEKVLVPLREQVVRLQQERVNFMLIGQFEALLGRREQYAAYGGYLDALRDYWLARVDLAHAAGGTLKIDAATSIDAPLGADAPAAHGEHEGHAMPGPAPHQHHSEGGPTP